METGSLPPIDKFRERWRRRREREGLVDPEDPDFGTRGLARLLGDDRSRLLILPADPEVHLIDFDDEFWAWWASDFDDPATDGNTQWGPHKRPTTAAAVFGVDYGEEQGWRRYIALHRCGALEVGIGGDGSRSWNDERRFWLGPIVARCWAGLARYGEVITKFELEPPHELALALCDTRGALLGGFAEGWAEPGSFEYMSRPCQEPGLLMRREFTRWPQADEAEQVAFSLGAQIEDAWGVTQRRFLAYRGDYAGRFDPRAAGWG